MLARRAKMLAEREAATSKFAKATTAAAAKPGGIAASGKLESLRMTKEERENEFERCSKTATAEVRRFHQLRLMEMRDTMVQYTEGQIRCARDALGELGVCVDKLREFPVPQIAYEQQGQKQE